MISCSKCNTPLPPESVNTGTFIPCRSCGSKTKADLFPAAFRTPEPGEAARNTVMDLEAECYYHPGKKAVIPCATCGRFLCSLCDADMGGEHVCFSCLESGRKKHKRLDLEKQRTLWDNLALNMALYPLLFFWITIVTAPVALYLSIRHYSSPSSIIPRTKIRYWMAGFFSTLQILGWGFFMFDLIKV